ERVAEDLERAGPLLTGRPTEGVGGETDRDVDEAGLGDEVAPRVHRPAAGDAVGPQLDVAARLVGDLATDGDVGDLQDAARAQDPARLGQGTGLVGHEVQHPVGDHDIGPAVVDG